MTIKEAAKELVDITPEVPIGYIPHKGEFKEELLSLSNSIGGIFKEIKANEYQRNRDDRSVEYVFVENIEDQENGYKLAYDVLEGVGLVVLIQKKPFDIWEISKKFTDNFLSEPAVIEIENDFALITSKKLLRS